MELTRYICTKCGAAYHSNEKQATRCNKCLIENINRIENKLRLMFFDAKTTDT